jgi:DNA invertase Pin-like site-specific DNA recombinase
MNIGYVRVSSESQNIDGQTESLEKYNIDKWFVDKVSGKDFNRPSYQEMLAFVSEGDVIHVTDWSRFGRSLVDVLKQLELLKEKKVKIVSVKENIDFDTPQGEFMMTIILGFNQMERTLIRERQTEGIAIAKAKGKYKGRPKKKLPGNWKEIINQYNKREINLVTACRSIGVSKSTFYKLRREVVK